MKRTSLTSGKECIRVVDVCPATLEYIQPLLASESYHIEPATTSDQSVEERNISSKSLLYNAKQYRTTPIVEELVARSTAGIRTAHV